eukprot:4159549-Pyramimonas_sp.AAC.1
MVGNEEEWRGGQDGPRVTQNKAALPPKANMCHNARDTTGGGPRGHREGPRVTAQMHTRVLEEAPERLPTSPAYTSKKLLT